MGMLFDEILVRPLLNALVFFYNLVPDFGVAIIILTVVIKLLLYPLNQRAIKMQAELAVVQPKIKEIRERYKNDFKQQHEALQKLYQEHNIKNPFVGCLPMLIQLPILIALFQVFRLDFGSDTLSRLYAFVPKPTELNRHFLGLFDLGSTSILVAAAAGVAQFFQTRATLPKQKKEGISKTNIQEMMGRQMMYMLPVMTVVFGAAFPAALPFYWLVSTLLTIGQQELMKRKPKEVLEGKK